MAQKPFDESIIALMNDPSTSTMDANCFVLICKLIETTEVKKSHGDMMNALQALAWNNGHQFMDEFQAATETLKKGMVEAADKSLTDRELAVLLSVDRGLTSAEIAAEWAISVSTIDRLIHGILKKLGVHSRQDAVEWVKDHGLMPLAYSDLKNFVD